MARWFLDKPPLGGAAGTLPTSSEEMHGNPRFLQAPGQQAVATGSRRSDAGLHRGGRCTVRPPRTAMPPPP